MTTPEARLTEIQTTIADARSRLEEGYDATIELAPLLDEVTRIERGLEAQGIELSEVQWTQANDRRAYLRYQIEGADHAKLTGMIEAAREKKDLVQLFLIAEALPVNSAARALAERPLVDAKGLRQQIRRDASRIRDLRIIPSEKRRKNYEDRQALVRVSDEDLIAKKRAQLGAL